MKTLSKIDCFRIIRATGMPDHIVAHSLLVYHAALAIARGLEHADGPVDKTLIAAAALLHDITKAKSFTTGENHAVTGGRMLDNLGCFEIGQVIRQHVRLDDYDFSCSPTEAEIVNYADKRVLHDKVVSLARRMDYIQVKYCKNDEACKRMHQLRQVSEKLERKIFKKLPFEPQQLHSCISTERLEQDHESYFGVRNPFDSEKLN